MSDTLALFAFLFASFCTASGGAVWRPGAWYDTLAKPSWQPPKWLFGPVWSVLYLMIAISGWLASRLAEGAELRLAMAVFAVQLLLNFLWSGLFFGMKRMDLALAEMAALWLSIAATIAVFWPISQTAALLLIPYLLWVSFAFFLNFTLLRLNRGRVGTA